MIRSEENINCFTILVLMLAKFSFGKLLKFKSGKQKGENGVLLEIPNNVCVCSCRKCSNYCDLLFAYCAFSLCCITVSLERNRDNYGRENCVN